MFIHPPLLNLLLCWGHSPNKQIVQWLDCRKAMLCVVFNRSFCTASSASDILNSGCITISPQSIQSDCELLLNSSLAVVWSISKDRMVLNECEDDVKDSRSDMKHVDKSVMIRGVLQELLGQVKISSLWNRQLAIKIAGFLDCKNCPEIKIKLLTCFIDSLTWCKNIPCYHHSDMGTSNLFASRDRRHTVSVLVSTCTLMIIAMRAWHCWQ